MNRQFVVGALLVILPCASAAAQPEPAKPKRYEYRPKTDPVNGTGKWYMNREIAPVMSYHGAAWLERPEREKEEQASRLYAPLKIKAGAVVCDMGAGSGYHTLKLSEIVGAQGKVYAVDVQPEMIKILGKRLKDNKVTNVKLIQGTVKDPKLPAEELDLILMVDVYHEFTYPYEMTEKMVQALKPGGRLVFVEYRLEDERVPILVLHRMSILQVQREMAQFPLRHVETQKHLPWQHVIIFEKKADKTGNKTDTTGNKR